jgi:hypothetical protein
MAAMLARVEPTAAPRSFYSTHKRQKHQCAAAFDVQHRGIAGLQLAAVVCVERARDAADRLLSARRYQFGGYREHRHA